MTRVKRHKLPALPEKTRSSRILEAVLKHRSTEPKRLERAGLRTSEREITKTIDAALKRMYLIEGMSLREIERSGIIGYDRARTRLPQIINPAEEKTAQLHRFVTKSRSAKTKSTGKRMIELIGPSALEKTARENAHLQNKEIAEKIGVDSKSIPKLMRILGIGERERFRIKRRELLKWTLKEEKIDPHRLSYNFLYHNNRKRLSNILAFFSVEPNERDWNSRAIYDRFLSAMGMTPKDVGMAESRAKQMQKLGKGEETPRDQRKAKQARRADTNSPKARAILKFVNKPIPHSEVLAEHGSPNTLAQLVEEGKLVKSCIGGGGRGKRQDAVYYFKPGQEKAVEGIRRKEVKKAIENLEYNGKTSFSFGTAELEIVVGMRLDRAMVASEIVSIKSPLGPRKICSNTRMSEVLAQMPGVKGPVAIGKHDVWYKKGQERTLGRFERDAYKHGKKSSRS